MYAVPELASRGQQSSSDGGPRRPGLDHPQPHPNSSAAPAQPRARCPSLELSLLPSLQRVSSSRSLPGSQARALWRALPTLGLTFHCFSWSEGRQGTGAVAVMCLGRQ